MKRRNNNIYILSVCALMLAIMLIFGFTPLGTISTAGLTITLMGIPVAIIACTFGPLMGAFAGLIWGTIAIIQAFCGMDAVATVLLGADISSGLKFGGLVCICYCRVIVGFLTGLIYDAIRIIDKKGYVAPFVASMSTAILNTILFMSLFVLFYFTPNELQSIWQSYGLNTDNAFLFVVGFVGINFVAEFITNMVIGGAASFGISKAAEKIGVSDPFPHFFRKKESVAE